MTPTAPGLLSRSPSVGVPILGAVIAATMIAACGSSSNGSSGSGSGGQASVATAQTSLGAVLTGPSGMTVYVLLSTQGTPVPCTGSCASVWPPVTVSPGTSPQPGSGVTANLAVVTLSDGTMQMTANRSPVHYFSRDSGPGQTSGQGINSFGGVWYALQADGQPAKSGGSGY